MVDKAIADVFYTRIVNDSDEEYRALFVAPKAGVVGGLVAPCCIQEHFE